MNRNVELGCDHRNRYQHGCVFGDSEDVSTERGWLSGLSLSLSDTLHRRGPIESAQRNGVSTPSRWRWSCYEENKVDMIVFNPPYVPTESEETFLPYA